MTTKRTCHDCEDGTRYFQGVHPSRAGSRSAMEAPDEWSETCETCGGTGEVEDYLDLADDEDF